MLARLEGINAHPGMVGDGRINMHGVNVWVLQQLLVIAVTLFHAERVAAFAGTERHAGRAQHGLLQAGGVLVGQKLLGQNGYCLRRVQQRLGKFPRGLQVIDLVRRGRVGIGILIGRLQTAGVGIRHGRGRSGRLCASRRAAKRCARP